MIARVTVILQSIPSQAEAAAEQQLSILKDRDSSIAVKNEILPDPVGNRL